jgi:predicted Zn-dependent peptidase
MRDIMGTMQRDGVSVEELRWAKDAIINGLVFSVDSTAQVVARRMFLEYDGLPADFLERYRERIEGVTANDILAVARDFLKPRAAVMVVVGKEGKFDGSLEEFGPITHLHLRKY